MRRETEREAPKRKPTVNLMVLAVMAVGVFIFFYLSSKTVQQPAVEAALTSAIHSTMQAGTYPASVALATALGEDQRSVILQNYTHILAQCYTEASGAIESLSEQKRDILYSQATIVSHTLAEGIWEMRTVSLKISENTATVEAEVSAWIKRIEEKDGLFYLTIPARKDRIGAVLVQEGGNWKVDQYAILETDAESDCYADRGRGFPSYEAALAAAEAIKPENPFTESVSPAS